MMRSVCLLMLVVYFVLETVIAFRQAIPCRVSQFRHVTTMLSLGRDKVEEKQVESAAGGVLDFRQRISVAAKEGFGTKARNVARSMSVGDIVVPLCSNLTQRQLLANRGIYTGVEYIVCSLNNNNNVTTARIKPAYPLRDYLERDDWPVLVQPLVDVPLWLSKTTYEAGTLLGTLSLSLTYLTMAAIFAFFFTFAYVPSESMIPTLQPGNVVLVARSFFSPRVGDVVLFDPPPNLNQIIIQEQKAKESPNKGQQFLKRVVAVPGECIGVKNSEPYVELNNNNPTRTDSRRLFRADIIGPYARPDYFSENSWNRPPEPLGKNEFFVAGDNGYRSVDSRVWGNLNRRYIFGTAQWVVWPPDNFGPIAPGNISEFEK